MLNGKNIMLAVLFVTSVSCQRYRNPISRAGNIIDENDIVPVSVALESGQVSEQILNRSLRAVALVVTADKHCIGSLVRGSRTKGKRKRNNLRIITNQHCFVADGRRELHQGVCATTRVYFNFAQAEKPLSLNGCKQGSLRSHFASDLVIFTLNKKLASIHRPFVLWGGQVPAGREAFLLHYPNVIHNLSSPGRSVALLPSVRKYFPILAVSSEGCEVMGRPQQGLWSKLPFGMAHSCDMTKGSDGAALIDLQTGRLLGISWGGLKIKLGEITQKINFSTSADFLRRFMAGRPVVNKIETK